VDQVDLAVLRAETLTAAVPVTARDLGISSRADRRRVRFLRLSPAGVSNFLLTRPCH
jgi:hypothetical protein